MPKTILPAPFLKSVLLADALVSGAVAGLQLLGGEPLGMLQWLAMACTVASLSLALLEPAGAKRP